MADLLEPAIVSMTTPPWMEQFIPIWLSTFFSGMGKTSHPVINLKGLIFRSPLLINTSGCRVVCNSLYCLPHNSYDVTFKAQVFVLKIYLLGIVNQRIGHLSNKFFFM